VTFGFGIIGSARAAVFLHEDLDIELGLSIAEDPGWQSNIYRFGRGTRPASRKRNVIMANPEGKEPIWNRSVPLRI
jgi:hypothetical protein